MNLTENLTASHRVLSPGNLLTIVCRMSGQGVAPPSQPRPCWQRSGFVDAGGKRPPPPPRQIQCDGLLSAIAATKASRPAMTSTRTMRSKRFYFSLTLADVAHMLLHRRASGDGFMARVCWAFGSALPRAFSCHSTVNQVPYGNDRCVRPVSHKGATQKRPKGPS